MKITNNSQARQGIRTASGLAWIKPGETRDVEPSEAGLKQAKRLKFLKFGDNAETEKKAEATRQAIRDARVAEEKSKVEEKAKAEEADRLKREQDSSDLKAVHRGRGSYSVMRGDEELREGLSKEDAEAFNSLSAEDREAYVKS